MAKSRPSQMAIVLKYYQDNPGRDIAHKEVVDWVTAEFERLTGDRFRDPDRAIRTLAQRGELIKVGTGIYRYISKDVRIKIRLEDFSAKIKLAILERDGHRCVICGRGERDGVTLHVDHCIPKDKGGRATLENGQTLCAPHNFKKKNYDQFEFGLGLFQRLRKRAIQLNDTKTIEFCDEVIAVFQRHGA